MQIVLRSALASLSFALLQSQNAYIVDDDGGAGVSFTSLQAAVDGVPDGSVLLLREGAYAAVLIDGRTLTVAAEPGQSVSVSGGFEVRNLGPTQRVAVRGLHLGGVPPLYVDGNQGLVWIEECTLETDLFPSHGCLVTASTDVLFDSCLIQGEHGFDGMYAVNSSVYVYDTACRGGNGTSGFGTAGPGGNGGIFEDCFLYASDSSFVGMDGGSECDFSCENYDGGDGLVLGGMSGSHAFLNNTTAVRGLAGHGADAAPGQNGQDYVVHPLSSKSHKTETARSLSLNAPTRTDEMVNITVEGKPFEFVFFLFGRAPQAPVYVASLFDMLLQTNVVGTTFAGATDGTGQLLYSSFPTLNPAATGTTRYIQALFYDPAAPVGQRLNLGPATALVVVDDTL